jgi:hypothetical protein
MAQFTEEEYRKVRLRGFEPADGYNPLVFTECYSIRYDEYTSVQTAVDVPVSILPIGNLTDWVRGDIILDKIVWFSKVPAASTSTPAGAAGIRVTTGSHTSGGDTWGDATIYFIDENGNNLPNSFYISSGGINEESIMPGHSGDCYITLCYRTDISEPRLLFGMKYDLYRQSGVSYRLLTDRAIQLGYQGVGVPNEPFLSWYQQNSDSNWYDDWDVDRVKYGIKDSDFSWSPDCPCVLNYTGLVKQEHRELFKKLLPKYLKKSVLVTEERVQYVDERGIIELDADFKGNAVVFFDIQTSAK